VVIAGGLLLAYAVDVIPGAAGVRDIAVGHDLAGGGSYRCTGEDSWWVFCAA